MNRLQISPLAKNDLHEIRSYITDELKNPSAAGNVVKRITKKLRRLKDFPLMGSTLSSIVDVETDYRFLVCDNYMAFYRYDDKVVYIIRVLLGRRDFIKILFGNELMDNDEPEMMDLDMEINNT